MHIHTILQVHLMTSSLQRRVASWPCFSIPIVPKRSSSRVLATKTGSRYMCMWVWVCFGEVHGMLEDTMQMYRSRYRGQPSMDPHHLAHIMITTITTQEQAGKDFETLNSPGDTRGLFTEIKLHPTQKDWMLAKALRNHCQAHGSDKWCAYDVFVSKVCFHAPWHADARAQHIIHISSSNTHHPHHHHTPFTSSSHIFTHHHTLSSHILITHHHRTLGAHGKTSQPTVMAKLHPSLTLTGGHGYVDH